MTRRERTLPVHELKKIVSHQISSFHKRRIDISTSKHLGLQVCCGGVAPPLLAVGQHGQLGGVQVARRQGVEAQPQLAHHVRGVGGEALGVAPLLVLEEAQQQDGVRLVQGQLDLQAAT